MAFAVALAGIMLSVAIARVTENNSKRRPGYRPKARPARRWTRIPSFIGIVAALAIGLRSLDAAVPAAIAIASSDSG